jgi:DNA (cytosine-5)-methyltransferase 1
MERTQITNKKYDVVSLFSGIGGFDLGFENAGFNVIWANDFDKYAVQTYQANIGDQIVLGDINALTHSIPNHDVLIGGFPCQPFSSLGKQKGFEDERGTLFFTIKEILKKYETKVVVLENVKNLKHHDKGKTLERMLRELEEIGYSCSYEVLNSCDFGVPQRRNRVFIVAFLKSKFKTDFTFKFPKKSSSLNISTQDLLDKNVDKKYFLTKNIAKTILSTGTATYKVKPTIDLPISKTLTATMHKMHRASQDNYVTDQESFEMFHDDQRINIRKLTPNECRKLQGFPSDWKQVVSDTQAYKQFGNAVTVNVVYALASILMDNMNEYLI